MGVRSIGLEQPEIATASATAKRPIGRNCISGLVDFEVPMLARRRRMREPESANRARRRRAGYAGIAMTLRLDRFDDFHLHGASAPEWNQRYLQLSPGRMHSSLTEATLGSMHVFRKWMDQRVVQQGCLPDDLVCFALVDGGGPHAFRAQGRDMSEHNLLILHSGEEFVLQRPEGLRILAVTLHREDLRRLVDQRPWPEEARRLLSKTMLRVPAVALHRLRGELLALLRASWEAAPIDDGDALRGVFESLGGMLGAACVQTQSPGSASASYIVAECHRIVAASAGDPPSVEALCNRLRVSRRSLQNSFRLVTGAKPTEYLRSVRLNLVRRRLMGAPGGSLSVSQAATDQGFEHLGHFGVRFRALFGEPPSTRRHSSGE
jgi:AraC-like DNA-binding protein